MLFGVPLLQFVTQLPSRLDIFPPNFCALLKADSLFSFQFVDTQKLAFFGISQRMESCILFTSKAQDLDLSN